MGKVKKSIMPSSRKYVDEDGKKKTAAVTPEDQMEIKRITDNYTDQSDVDYYINKYLSDKALQKESDTMQKHIDDSSKMNRGGMTMRKGNMAYNKGGMGKSKMGHTDYRKGGMVYTTKDKK